MKKALKSIFSVYSNSRNAMGLLLAGGLLDAQNAVPGNIL